MAMEVLGIVMEGKEVLEEELRRLKEVIQDLSMKMKYHEHGKVLRRILRVIIRKMSGLLCNGCEKYLEDDEDGWMAGCDNKGYYSEVSEPARPDYSTEDLPCLGWARAIVDYVPSPYNTEALSFQCGDLIKVTSMNEGGTWAGVCGGRRGTFKFVNVRMIKEETSPPPEYSLQGLFHSLGLSEVTARLELNGFDTLEKLQQVSKEDLDYIEIVGEDIQDKILTIATVVRFVTGEDDIY